ncbi:MAG: DNA-3-methyladenine glycosylase [Desulfobacterales bacterium]|nr:DNA-3-methyladenine glycosylase [Desulfobacterales bacterium]
MKKTIIHLTPIPPYDFELIAEYAAYFQGRYAADHFQDGVYRRLLDVSGRLCLVNVRSIGSVDAPSLEVTLKGNVLNEKIVSETRIQAARLLGTDQKLKPFYGMASKDPVLYPIVKELRGLHIPQTLSLWEGLTLAIIGQQVSSHVARIMRNGLVENYGLALNESGATYRIFPKPEALVEAGLEKLYSIKLSKRKAQYIFDIAAALASQERDLDSLRSLPDEEVVRKLMEIRGVGPWTAHWLLIRGLGRSDAFPHGDLALRRTMGNLYNNERLLQPEEALDYSYRWSPFRSFVTIYLFAAIRSTAASEKVTPKVRE